MDIFQLSRFSSYVKAFREPFLAFDLIFLYFIWILSSINIIHFVMLVSYIHKFPKFIVLHRNIYFGVDLITPWIYIFTVPFISVLLTLLNLLFSRYFYTRAKILSYFLMSGALVITTILFIGSIIILRQQL